MILNDRQRQVFMQGQAVATAADPVIRWAEELARIDVSMQSRVDALKSQRDLLFDLSTHALDADRRLQG